MPLALTLLVAAVAIGGLWCWFSERATPLRRAGFGLFAAMLPRTARGPHQELLALSSGLGAIIGACIAVAAAGWGALIWMWIGAGLCAAWISRELEPRRATRNSPRAAHSSLEDPPQLIRHRLGRAAGWVHRIAVVVLAITFGLALPVQQLAVYWHEAAHAPIVAVIVTIVGLTALLAVPRRIVTASAVGLNAAVPLCLTVFVLAVAASALQTPEPTRAAIEELWWSFIDPRATAAGLGAGVMLPAVQYGFLWAATTSGVGLGNASFAARQHRVAPADHPRVAAGAMILPLLSSCLVATCTALLLHTTGSSSEREVVAVRTADTGEDTKRLIFPLEREHRLSFQPSLRTGQLIMLPPDTPLVVDEQYPMRFRSNPRGHKIGRLDKEQNMVILPRWQIVQTVDTIVFRDRDESRRRNPGYDQRIAVRAEHVTNARGTDLTLLRPVDDNVDLVKLAGRYDGPYVVTSDFEFIGRVGRAVGDNKQATDELAMFEVRSPEDKPNPALRDVVSMGMAGPYFGTSVQRPPWAFVATEDFVPDLDSQLTLVMSAPARGLEIGDLTPGGELRTPAWDFLAETTTAVLRHKTDPSQDMRVPVEQELADDGTLRFRSALPEIVDFKRAHAMTEFTGPYLLPPDYVFDVEVRGGQRFPAEYTGRRALVPLHPLPEPHGGSGTVYTPHPYEVLLTNMEGPLLNREGLLPFADAVSARFPLPVRGLAGALLALLTLATTAAWCRRLDALFVGDESVRAASTRGRSGSIRLAILLVGCAAAFLPLDTLLKCVAWSAAVAIAFAAVALTLPDRSPPPSSP